MAQDTTKLFNKFAISNRETQVLSDTPYQIKRIIHLSDLHLSNNYECKEEYLGVFTNLIKTMSSLMTKYCSPADLGKLATIEKKAIAILSSKEDSREKSNRVFLKSTLVFVTGDMVDNGNTYNVNTMIFLRNIFRALNLFCYTIIINGNHDYLYTKDSQEGITSLTGDFPNLYFLKYSGNYIFNNLFIHNYSVYCETIPNLNIETDKTRVAIYHGQINVDTPRETTEIKYNALPACAFKANIILAGDKHTHRYVNKEKTSLFI
jgi:predicted MPP superfamily phosphohydrolase